MCNKYNLGNINGYPLDEQQLKAATCEDKFSVIVAGAGSGKSTTMIGKIKYLLEFKRVKPEEILCISFTNESTNNLKNNILKNCGIEIETKTFHKLALKILQDNHVKFNLAPSNYLTFTVSEFFLSKDNFFAIINTINFLKNKFYIKNWNEYLKIINTKDFECLKALIIKFLNLYFSQYNSEDMLKEIFINNKNTKNASFLKLVLAIYHSYEAEKKSQNLIDYDDMIKLATKIILNGGVISNYKYIIIDEFQDTSQIRFELILAIISRNNSNLTVVGDDFQSIYRFSGCNLNIFLDFTTKFSNASILKIENTYRNSQEIIDVAGSFIMRNPQQIKKNLKAYKRLSKPIKIVYGKNNTLKNILYHLNKTNNKNVLILGRNNFDIKKYLSNDLTMDNQGNIKLINCNNIDIRFLSVHKSKGLEADNVIILNLINSKFGFPNKIEDHPILNLINNIDNFLFEEERRLFYVALTRTKNNVYLLTEKNNSSIFIKELLKDYKQHIEIIKKI